MGGQNSWRIPDDNMSDYLRQQEKRMLHEERRPLIRSASALLGPGFAPFAVPLVDWNADETLFNGMFYSDAGAQNSPDILRAWIGHCLATDTGYGIQTVWEFQDGVTPPDNYIRTFSTTSGSLRTFTAWTLV